MTEIYLLLGIFALIFNYATDQICNLNQLRQADDIKLVFCSYYEWFDSCLLFFFSLQGFIGIYWQESSYNSVVGRKNVTLHQLPWCKAIQGNFLLCTRLCIITFNGCILSALTSFTLVFFLSPCQPNRSKAERVISREFPIKSQEVHNKLKEVLTFFIFILFFLLIGVSQLVQKSSGHQLKETPLKPFL